MTIELVDKQENDRRYKKQVESRDCSFHSIIDCCLQTQSEYYQKYTNENGTEGE